MLATLPPEDKSEWKNSIEALGQAYNCTQNSTTDFSPYIPMYGRQPQLPFNITLGLTPKLVANPTSTKYVQKLRECIRWAHKKANLFLQKEVWCQNSATGFSPYFLMYGRQPQLSINITLGLTPKSVAMSTSTKYVQKLRECIRWAIRRPNYSNRRRCGATNRIMTNAVRQWPWGWETWSWSMSPHSRADTKSRTGGKTGNM